jgi:hypothetical protein
MILNVQLGDTGLILDFIGGILLFFYGIAPLLSKDGSMSLSTGNGEYLRRKAQRYEALSRLGVSLIVLGFVFQLLGNHIRSTIAISAIVLVFALVAVIVIITLAKLFFHYRRRRYDLRALYLPQFEKSKPAHIGEQLWHFIVTNNSKAILKEATLYFDIKPSIVTVLIHGEGPESKTSAKSLKLKDIQPNKPVIVQAWNTGGHITAGLDCYLEIGGKIIRPRVTYFNGIE